MSPLRLGVDRIDLLYLHRVDPDVPFADQIGPTKELWDEGKIAHVGPSEVVVEQIEAARAAVDVAVRNIYNLTTRADTTAAANAALTTAQSQIELATE
ncbi:aldo/keto reductase [Streptomyces sp. NBC_01217]|uniref:aldo/keto reductase n=1 Tax=Streptomyces sp. NBC_01217 TaxID=2903779 RepID=UPI002E15DECF|nr:aldo/keto reductase [Streptomyces sp. NBC_01217]